MPKVPNTFRCTGSSCAACTYNRKRCQPWCEYAPIFRDVISRQDYRTIFTVFGVKNVADILQNIPQYQHLETLYSFLFEAKARIENPIKGCTALLASLEQKVEELQERVTALEARSEGGPSCVNPLCSFAPPRGSSRFISSVENNAADVIPSAVNPPEPVPGDFLRFLMSAEEIAPEIPPPTVNLMESEAFLTEVEPTSPDWTALGDIRHDFSSDLTTENQIIDRLGDGFTRATFATVVPPKESTLKHKSILQIVLVVLEVWVLFD
ncbi:hypothetical protein LguiB_006596 [Lonicera macranthoides]